MREVPVDTAGIYAPGGRAAYPSSVLMCAIPAQVAGVRRIALATPPGPDGHLDPLVLAAAELCGVDEVYAMGGAQAIFALAYGTETIAAVDVIAGPGNAWVREAKRAVYGRVGIDSLAGPSELMLIAGHDTDPRVGGARPLRPGRAWRGRATGGRGRASDGSRAASPPRPTAPPRSVPASPTPRSPWSRSPARPRRSISPTPLPPSTCELVDRRGCSPGRPGHDRRLRLRRSLQRHRLRRLRRRLQPRASHRRSGALLRSAWPRRLPPQDRDSGGPGRGSGEAGPARRANRSRRGIPGSWRVGDD